ncbi:MAG: DNA polymerase III subunit gamma/tau [Spirochaetaceae bacterium]|nr:MAG: DNA polymerase III subunit gamma/tau [Spirochaetaceae bacterium]
MEYEVTAGRKRPHSFDKLAGQEFVVSTLKNALNNGQIAHAYLFSGPRGVGKTSAARILAAALNCPDGPRGEDFSDYPEASEIARGESIDVIEIDGASNTSVNDVRQIKEEVLFAPSNSRYKIYIIDEVHMLSNSAFNALLKTIEEPPPYVAFIFATTEVHKVPATIRSRCQQFHFRLIPVETIRDHLSEACLELGIEAEHEALFWIAKEAGGSLRDAYTLFDQVVAFSSGSITMEKISKSLGLVGLDRLNAIVELLAAGDVAVLMETADDIVGSGVPIEQFVVDLSEYFRSLMLLQHGITKESLLGFSPERYSARAKSAWNKAQLEHGLELTLELYRRLRYSLNERFELELLLSRLASLGDYISHAEILRRLEELRSMSPGGKSPGTPVAAPAPAPGGSASRQRPANQASELEARSGRSAEEYQADHHNIDTQNNELDEDNEPAQDYQPDEDYRHGDPKVLAAPQLTTTARSAFLLEQEKIDEIVAGVKQHKLALGAVVENATRWELNDNALLIVFASAFAANEVKKDIGVVRDVVCESLDEDVAISVQVENADGELKAIELDQTVATVKKVFRGEVIEE